VSIVQRWGFGIVAHPDWTGLPFALSNEGEKGALDPGWCGARRSDSASIDLTAQVLHLALDPTCKEGELETSGLARWIDCVESA
jgi:hypothetical protein